MCTKYRIYFFLLTRGRMIKQLFLEVFFFFNYVQDDDQETSLRLVVYKQKMTMRVLGRGWGDPYIGKASIRRAQASSGLARRLETPANRFLTYYLYPASLLFFFFFFYIPESKWPLNIVSDQILIFEKGQLGASILPLPRGRGPAHHHVTAMLTPL